LRTQARYGGALDAANPDDATVETDVVTARVVRDGADVLYLQAPSPPLGDLLLAALR
jgi:hypothetical protein